MERKKRGLRGGLSKHIFLCMFFFSVFRVFASSCAAGEIVSADWTWDILVVPPEEGWDTPEGESVRNTLLWHRAEIFESGEGLLGRDIEFVFLPPVPEEDMEGYVLPLSSRTIAVFSFAPWPVDRKLVGIMAGKGIPLMLAGGENVFFYDNGKLQPFVFGLDLFRDYRSRAFAGYASRSLSPEVCVGIIGARFTLFEERDARICRDLLDEAHFLPVPFWVDASVRDMYDLVVQEIKSCGEGVLISFVGGMATRELWRSFSGAGSLWRLWYGGTPDDAFLSYNGIVFADQNRPLNETGVFETLRRELWSSRAVAVTDRVAAGRANALVLWVARALSGLKEGEFDRNAFLSRLAGTKGIPFGDQILDIDPGSHRPARRRVFILQTRNRSFFVLDSADVSGPGYYDY